MSKLFDRRLFTVYCLEQGDDLLVAPLGNVGQLLAGHYFIHTLHKFNSGIIRNFIPGLHMSPNAFPICLMK